MGSLGHRRTILALDVALFAILLGVAWSGATVLLALAVLLVVVMLWFKGFVRFARARRFVSTLGIGLVNVARRRGMNRRAAINLAIVVGSIVALIVLNQLRLAAPGKGRGLSLAFEMPSLNFGQGLGGVSSPGAWIGVGFSYAALFAVLGLAWFRLWQSVQRAPAAWRNRAYWGCVAAFVAMPLLFTLLMATAAPEAKDEASAKANADFSTLWLGIIQTFMGLAFCGAAALPHVGPPPARAEQPVAPIAWVQ